MACPIAGFLQLHLRLPPIGRFFIYLLSVSARGEVELSGWFRQESDIVPFIKGAKRFRENSIGRVCVE